MEHKQYWLKKEGLGGEFDYTDQDGVSWDNPYQWLWGFLGGCGCGSADDFAKEAYKLLDFFATTHIERKWSVYDDRFFELMAHWFDEAELIEHGTSVGSSWLSEKGEQIYKQIKELLMS